MYDSVIMRGATPIICRKGSDKLVRGVLLHLTWKGKGVLRAAQGIAFSRHAECERKPHFLKYLPICPYMLSKYHDSIASAVPQFDKIYIAGTWYALDDLHCEFEL
jgi:hypothetical protein